MAAHKGFTIEVTSRYEEWWRYNVALMCGCFDAANQRIGFASAASDVADVGSNLTERPDGIAADRSAVLETMPCDHLVLYLYIIPIWCSISTSYPTRCPRATTSTRRVPSRST